MAFKKVLIKVVNDATDKFEWRHIAYADEELYLRFLSEMQCKRIEFADYVAKWVKEDFNYDVTMAHSNDIEIVKKLVCERYRRAYPYLVIQSKTDRQGWMRVWITKHMEEELNYFKREVR